MPYIIISSTMDPTSQHAAFTDSITLIEYHVDGKAERDEMEMRMKRLEACRSRHGETSPFCTFISGQPPYFVLNRLETEGYKVVGTNTISNYLIWTLHRKPEPIV